MIVLAELSPLLIIAVGIVSLLTLLFALRSYRAADVASGLTLHVISFVGYGILFTYLWQTVGSYGHNSIWLAALMTTSLILFLAPLDDLVDPGSEDSEQVQKAIEPVNAEDATSP